MANRAAPKPKRPRVVRLAVWLAVSVVVLSALGAAIVYTEQPAFCRVCHEMQPYDDAWAVGTHAKVGCMDCHIAPGLANRLAHKSVALREVWNHFTTDPKFPMMRVEIPNETCMSCHAKTRSREGIRFSHDLHLEKSITCAQCHAEVGHKVTYASLVQAGILAPGAQPSGATYVGQVVFGSKESTPLAGHVEVKCSGCHGMASAACDYCHPPPEDHFPWPCTQCHSPSVPLAETVFTHPSETDCARCHTPPKDHFPWPCTQCHSVDVPFAETTFVHPAETNCVTCHKAPKGHYTTQCATCHSVKIAFDRTVFRHPGVGEEHSYRSFPCSYCHPKSYSVATCTRCHKGGAPTDGD